MNTSAFRTYARAVFEEEVRLLRTLAQIPAPSGKEGQRAAFVASWLRDAGAPRVEIDDQQNVLCWVSETPATGIEVFSAHTDVVFDDLTPLPLREEDDRMYAPGVGDDTANLVGLLMGTRWLLAHPEATRGRSILVVANTCEEGLGNLRGTRALYDRYGSNITSHVVFDTTLGNVVCEAVGSVRWRVCCDGPGGHSFKAFGTPNAIVELSRLVCDLDHMKLPAAAVTTQNVGTISGGTTVNSIAAHAEMLFELRSTSDTCLTAARKAFEQIVQAHQSSNVRFTTEIVGERPASAIGASPALDALAERACAATRAATGLAEVNIVPSSTDANIPLSQGIPAVCLGAVRGKGAHTRNEWIETTSLEDGLVAVLTMLVGQPAPKRVHRRHNVPTTTVRWPDEESGPHVVAATNR